MAAVPVIYLDTHVVVWLYTRLDKHLSRAALEEIKRCPDLRVSPMVRLELQYLYEIGRTTQPPGPVLDNLAARIGLSVCQSAFSAVVIAAEHVQWTRDPFDRLIVAHASLHNARLLTNDGVIRDRYPHALW
jgi:PIN domain nuclease of toxin-antitoxin system